MVNLAIYEVRTPVNERRQYDKNYNCSDEKVCGNVESL